MTSSAQAPADAARSVSALFQPAANDLVRVGSRRWFLQTGLAGLGGLTLPQMLRASESAASGKPAPKSILMFWLSGGLSHIDSWDPKIEAPREIRGPFDSIPTSVPGIRFSEHLPLQASLMDKLTIIRSIDCRSSNHTPITMQAGNSLARRSDDGNDGLGYPSMGSIAAKFRGSNNPNLPAFVGLAESWKADVWESGQMGSDFAPVKGSELAGRFMLPEGVQLDRLQDRQSLRQQFDRLRRDVDRADTMSRTDRYTQQAFDLVLSGQAQKAFAVDQEPAQLRDAYGRDSIGEKALLARRLIESGVSYVLVSGAWGYFDHHGDEVRWGGIEKGLKPLLPRIDQVIGTLLNDLESRGLLDSTLVLMLGEFGRGPVMTKTAGRDHWTNCMSMLVAGGGFRHGQVIGSTDARGYGIHERPIRPEDLAATVFRHLDIDLSSHWINPQGRPVPIVNGGGKPIAELS